jgi:hypothetical protein
MQRGLSQRPLIKKEAILKNAKRLIKKDLQEKKRGNKKNNAKGLIKKTSEDKRGNPKISNTHMLIETSFADLTVEGEDDVFWFRPQITSRMKATN